MDSLANSAPETQVFYEDGGGLPEFEEPIEIESENSWTVVDL